MHRKQNDVFFVIHAQKTDADERALRQIERQLYFFASQSHHLRLSLLEGDAGQVNQRKLDLVSRTDYLQGPSFKGGEDGSQDLVTPHDLAQRLAQRVDAKSTRQSHRGRAVVKRSARLKLIKKPEPLLRVRKWKFLVARNRLDG